MNLDTEIISAQTNQTKELVKMWLLISLYS